MIPRCYHLGLFPWAVGVGGWRAADGGAEVAGEMGLVEVAEVAGEEPQVDVVALVEALDRLVEAGALDDPLRVTPV